MRQSQDDCKERVASINIEQGCTIRAASHHGRRGLLISEIWKYNIADEMWHGHAAQLFAGSPPFMT